MRTVGQSPWDDIKILGQSMGHLISNSKSGGTAPPLSFPPAARPCWCHECLSQEVLTNERLGKNKEVCNCLCKQWSFFDMGITPVAGTRVGHWYQNLRKNPGTLISKKSRCPTVTILRVCRTSYLSQYMQLKTRKKRGKSNRKRMSNLAWLWSSCWMRNDASSYSAGYS